MKTRIYKSRKTTKVSALRKSIRRVNRYRKATGFEKKVYGILDELDIPFVKEKTVGRCHADISIGKHTLIECQGCYFHGCKKCFPKPSDRQKEAISKDARRFWFFDSLGFKLIEIWECDLKKHPEAVKRKLKEAAETEANG